MSHFQHNGHSAEPGTNILNQALRAICMQFMQFMKLLVCFENIETISLSSLTEIACKLQPPTPETVRRAEATCLFRTKCWHAGVDVSHLFVVRTCYARVKRATCTESEYCTHTHTLQHSPIMEICALASTLMYI